MSPKDPDSDHTSTDTAPKREAEEAISRYILANEVTLDERTESWRLSGRSVSSTALANYVWVDHIHLPTKLFVTLLEKRAARLRDGARRRVEERLLPSGREERTNAALDALVALTSREDTPEATRRYYKMAWRQLVWQIKRRMVGRCTSSEVMVVLTGPQGTGKSTFMRAFAAPLSFLCLHDATFAVFSDSFRQQVFERNFLVLLDEMERGSSTDIEAVKRTITAPYIQSRVMRSQQEASFVRNASFLGASNFGVATHIRDPTGMRRFVEIEFRRSRVDDEWLTALRGLDMAGVWQCVSADTNVPPLLDDRDLVDSHQRALVTFSPFDLWYEECVYDSHASDRVTLKDVWENYSAWCRKYEERPLGRNTLSKRLDGKLQSVRPQNVKTYTGIRLSTSSFT